MTNTKNGDGEMKEPLYWVDSRHNEIGLIKVNKQTAETVFKGERAIKVNWLNTLTLGLKTYRTNKKYKQYGRKLFHMQETAALRWDNKKFKYYLFLVFKSSAIFASVLFLSLEHMLK